MWTLKSRIASAIFAAALVMPALAQNCGWSCIDHEVSYDATGISQDEPMLIEVLPHGFAFGFKTTF